MESSATDKLPCGIGAVEAGAPIEIKIKTLDSQTYTLRVDKQVPVPALKEQIASVTGVLSEQQRLICRGKVLKDDQLLSAYHVEDGHTLHLVARQPDLASSGLPHHQASDPNSSGSHGHNSQSAPGVVIETFNMPVRGDRVTPDISRIFSAVIGSIGISNIVGGTEGIGVRENDPQRLERTTGLSGISEPSHPQPDQAGVQGLTEGLRGIFGFPSAVSLGSHPQVIPDSLSTMSLYLSHMRSQFDAIVTDPGNNVQAAEMRQQEGRGSETSSPGSRNQGFLSPASLAEVLHSTRNIFIGQAGECVLQLARQLESQGNIDDPLMRTNIQSNALQTGGQLYNLGAFLLEIGRTTMALRLGQTPSEAVVSSGPAVFISSSSPNPIMVQPLPFQSVSSLGSVPVGAAPSVSGFLPRRIDIQIRRGSSTSTHNMNREEDRGDWQHPTAQTNLGEDSVNHSTLRDSAGTSLPGESVVRVVPIRTVVASLPGSFSLPSDSLGSLPTLNTRQELPNARTVGVNVLTSGGAQRNQESEQQMPNHVLQFLRSAFPGGEIHVEGSALQGTAATSGEAGIARGAAQGPEAEANVSDEGVFLSNLLREIMPAISQHTGVEANASSQGPNASSEPLARESANHAGTNAGTSRRYDDNESSSPSSKRQKVFDGHLGKSTAEFVREHLIHLPRVIVEDVDFPLELEKLLTSQ